MFRTDCLRRLSVLAVPHFVLPLLFGAVVATGCKRAARGDAGEVPSALERAELRDQEGALLSLERLTGKTLVVNFMFASCPQICPTQTRQLALVRQALPVRLRANVRFLSISVDPENDSPATLKAFAKVNGANFQNWWFAVGTPERTRELAKTLAAFDPRAPNPVPGDHATLLYLFDKQGRLVQRYSGKPLDQERLVREIGQIDRLKREG